MDQQAHDDLLKEMLNFRFTVSAIRVGDGVVSRIIIGVGVIVLRIFPSIVAVVVVTVVVSAWKIL